MGTYRGHQCLKKASSSWRGGSNCCLLERMTLMILEGLCKEAALKNSNLTDLLLGCSHATHQTPWQHAATCMLLLLHPHMSRRKVCKCCCIPSLSHVAYSSQLKELTVHVSYMCPKSPCLPYQTCSRCSIPTCVAATVRPRHLLSLWHSVRQASAHPWGAHQGLSPNLGGLMGFLSGRVPMPRTSSMGALRTSCVQRSLNSSARQSGSGFPSLSNTFGAASPALAPASGPLCWPHSAASLLRAAARALRPSTKATCAADLCKRQRQR